MRKKRRVSILIILVCILTLVMSMPVSAEAIAPAAVSYEIEIPAYPGAAIEARVPEETEVVFKRCPNCGFWMWNIWSITWGRWNGTWQYVGSLGCH